MVVLTGATRGIGQAAAIELAKRGADLALVGRDSTRVDEVVDKARAAGQAGIAVSGQVADLAEMDEVRRLAAELETAYPRIDVLANNAGAKFDSKHTTTDGFEQTFALNHLAPFLLTNLLIDRLTEANARVVTTSSDAHHRAELDLEDLMFEDGRFRAWRAYGNSKLCNILFTRELARRLDGTGVTANSFHPGFVATRFGDQSGGLVAFGVRIAKRFALTPQQGAETLIYLASSPEVQGVTGEYFVRCHRATPTVAARDDEMARRLWEETARIADR